MSREKGAVAICFGVIEDLSPLSSREQVSEIVKRSHPEERPMSQAMAAGQLYRFLKEIQRADYILTPIKATRTVLIGKVEGDYVFNPSLLSSECPHSRKVEWLAEKSRDYFSLPARNTLGGLATVFRANDHLAEIERLVEGREPTISDETETQPPFYEDVKARADELIRDILARVPPYEFQELVAAMLRAMGYVAKVGPRGKDAGVDIVAHPDPLGFDSPRIKVQVKHRVGQTGRPEIQALSGTLHEGENGLFVSTGGFTKDAENWTSQSGKPITLVDGEAFAEMLLENYEHLATGAKALVPLSPVWIPTTE